MYYLTIEGKRSQFKDLVFGLRTSHGAVQTFRHFFMWAVLLGTKYNLRHVDIFMVKGFLQPHSYQAVIIQLKSC